MSDYKIKIDSDNRAFVEFSLRPMDNLGIIPIHFKYDPGADRTTISLRDLLTLGYDEKTVRSLMYPDGDGSTADGIISEWFAIDLRMNHIMGQVIPKGLKFPFVCMTKKIVPVPKQECEGCKLTGNIYGGFRSSLLGNDILSCFDIVTDRENNQVIFTRTKDINKRNKQYPNCEVSELISSNHNTPQPLTKLSSNAKTILPIVSNVGVTREAIEVFAAQYRISKDDTRTALNELEANKIIIRYGFTIAYKLVSNNS